MAHADYKPQLATLASKPPSGDRWLHEIKYDGYRIGCRIDKTGVRLISRNGNDWTDVFPSIAEAARTLRTSDALIDGEVAMVMPDGRTSFAALQQAAAGTASHAPLVYFVFDLLRLDGERLDRLPLEERKARLRALVEPVAPKPEAKAGPAPPKPEAKAGRIRYAEHIIGDGDKLLEHATKIGLEGIISKRRDLPYFPGRHDSWRKSKVRRHGTFVIGGMTDPQDSGQGLSALLVGYYQGPRLAYAGRVGTGFSHAFALELRGRLNALEQRTCPFDPPIRTGPERLARWVNPVLVCDVLFAEWTNDVRLRAPVFVRLRTDVKPTDVTSSAVRRPDPARAAVRSAGSPRR
jgi:bifunctional non-homologous end joining protein LigD